MNMKKKNLILLGALAVLGGLVLYWMRDLPSGTAATGYGPDFYPKVLLVVLAILAVILLIQTLMNKGDAAEDPNEEKPEPAENRHQWIMMAIFTAMGIAYALLLNTLGFIIASILLVLGGMKLMGGKWLPSIIISVVVVVVLYVGFKIGFKVQLPDGILGGIL